MNLDFFKIGGSWWVAVPLYLILAVCLFLLVRFREKIILFLKEVREELLKCTWPWDPEKTGLRKYKELIDSTVVVSIVTLLLACYVSVFDFSITRFIGLLINF